MAKTVMVTGGSGGIGFELARCFAGDGYNVILVAHNQKKLDDAADRLKADFGIEVHTISQDLSAPGAASALVEAFDATGIQLDALVNDAGFAVAGRFSESDWKRQEALIAVNIGVLTELSYRFGKRMADRGAGEILNVASIAAFMPGPYMATYYASKAYVQSFTQALHTELNPHGVHVCALCPGPVRTDFWGTAGFKQSAVLNAIGVPASLVAKAGYAALKANKTQCVPGILPKASVLFTRVAPRSLMRWIVTQLQRPTADAIDKPEGQPENRTEDRPEAQAAAQSAAHPAPLEP